MAQRIYPWGVNSEVKHSATSRPGTNTDTHTHTKCSVWAALTDAHLQPLPRGCTALLPSPLHWCGIKISHPPLSKTSRCGRPAHAQDRRERSWPSLWTAWNPKWTTFWRRANVWHTNIKQITLSWNTVPQLIVYLHLTLFSASSSRTPTGVTFPLSQPPSNLLSGHFFSSYVKVLIR